jgi:hypothetical protein
LCTFAAISEEPLDGPTLDIQGFAPAAQAQGLHLVQSWFWRLGMPPPRPPFEWPRLPVQSPPAESELAIAPFSGSEREGAWPPPVLFSNLWPAANWVKLLSGLSTKRVCLLCSNADNLGLFRDSAPLILAGRDLRQVCGTLKSAAVVLTIDNGIGWLAQALQRPHVLLRSSRHLRTWTNNPNPNAVNLPISADTATVLDRVNRLLEGRPMPAEDNVLLDRKIARMALLNAIWFAVRRDRDAAVACYRVWQRQMTLTQFALAGLEVLIAIGQAAVLLALRPWRQGRAILSGRARRV